MPRPTTRRQFLSRSTSALGVLTLGGRWAQVAAAPAATADDLMRKAIAFLKPRQEANGGWSTAGSPGITGVVATALLRSRQVTAEEPVVTRALAYLEGLINPDGGLGEKKQSNYVTAIALMAFHEANTRGRYDAIIKAGQKYLKAQQWDEGEGKDRDHPFYGGAGYGGSSRPDLSNTSFFLEALHDTGLPPDDPALKRALVFVSRCQNLKSEFNDQPWAGKVNDGGFIYTAAGGGVSVAGKDDESGGLRSYASMTYAGLKSMIHAGLTPDDPRVKAAVTYISKNYRLDENPGLGQAGLYYYYQTFARALSMLGKPTLTDASGKVHDWRAELVEALAQRQNPDGGWVNREPRFMEGDANLATAFGLLALAYAKAKV
jgi:squalene-hopene/tetraprenyl-beta-curcumene cyclase